MKTGIRDQGTGNRAAEETLRLIARLYAPDGLENRVQESLRVAAVPAARILRWSAWLESVHRLDAERGDAFGGGGGDCCRGCGRRLDCFLALTDGAIGRGHHGFPATLRAGRLLHRGRQAHTADA